MATFPYPYMNGYLHLGKFKISIVVLARLEKTLTCVFKINRSCVLNVEVRVYDTILETDWQACSVSICIPLHRYADYLGCHSP